MSYYLPRTELTHLFQQVDAPVVATTGGSVEAALLGVAALGALAVIYKQQG